MNTVNFPFPNREENLKLRRLKLFLNHMFTYVRTEVNDTEEVDDPVDSDGEHLLSLPHITQT